MFTTQFITTPEIVCTINDLLFPIFLFCLIFGLLCYLTYDYEQHHKSEEIDSKSDCVDFARMQSESVKIQLIKEEAITIVEKDKQAKLLIGLGIRNLILFSLVDS